MTHSRREFLRNISVTGAGWVVLPNVNHPGQNKSPGFISPPTGVASIFFTGKIDISSNGQLPATPIEGHGSGDFANLLANDAFLELPMDREEFKKGEPFPLWIFKQITQATHIQIPKRPPLNPDLEFN